MTAYSPFRLPVADLLRRVGSSRPFSVRAPVAGLGATGAEIPTDEAVSVEGTLERISEGIVVRAEITAPWHAACSRCLLPVSGSVAVHVDELFEPAPLEGETYGLDGETVDLEPLVRDALLLELPAAPLCRAECQGLCAQCGADRNTTACDCRTEELDPRWAALRSLDL